MRLKHWEKFLERALADSGREKMFIWKGQLYKRVKGHWRPQLPKDLLAIMVKVSQ